MFTSHHDIRLYLYRYDPLDRLIHCASSADGITQRFYCKDHLATVVLGVTITSIFQHDDQLLAQQRINSTQSKINLLATDLQRSVLNVISETQYAPLAYSTYGHRSIGHVLLSLLGFTGQLPEPVTGHYLFGNGYRAFSPVLMRFNSPDEWSPFGAGGLNAYAYCGGDPVNKQDPTGHMYVVKRITGVPVPNVDSLLSLAQKNKSINVGAQNKIRKELGLVEIPNNIHRNQKRLEAHSLSRTDRLLTDPENTTTRKSALTAADYEDFRYTRSLYTEQRLDYETRQPRPAQLNRMPRAPIARRVRFSDQPTIHEVERFVDQPEAGWQKVADVRR
jgi:RHS repeat-associated protein